MASFVASSASLTCMDFQNKRTLGLYISTFAHRPLLIVQFKQQENLFLKDRPENLHLIQRRVAVKKKRDEEEDRPSKKSALTMEPNSSSSSDNTYVLHTPASSPMQPVPLSAKLAEELNSSELFDYESRQQVQESTINWLISTVHQQRTEMAQLRAQMGVLTQYILKSNGIGNVSNLSPGPHMPSQTSVQTLEQAINGLALQTDSSYRKSFTPFSNAGPGDGNPILQQLPKALSHSNGNAQKRPLIDDPARIENLEDGGRYSDHGEQMFIDRQYPKSSKPQYTFDSIPLNAPNLSDIRFSNGGGNGIFFFLFCLHLPLIFSKSQ